MKKTVVLGLLLTGLFSGVVNSAVVSCWNFNQFFSGGVVPDQVGSNQGNLVGVQQWGGAWEGDAMINLPQDEWNRFYATTQGFSQTAGTYMFSYRSNGGTLRDWRDILGTNLFFDGKEVLRLEHYKDGGKNWLALFGGVTAPAYDATTLFDAKWHTVALTYANNDKVRLYIDGYLVVESYGNYSASSYTTLGTFAVGNRGNEGTLWANGLTGFYDRVLVLNHAASAAELPTYLNASFVPEPATLSLLAMGLIAGVYRRKV